MKALEGKTKLKLVHNSMGELVKVLQNKVIKKHKHQNYSGEMNMMIGTHIIEK